MRDLFATATYSFNNFYNNLNTRGQMIFSAIIFLILVLCALLFITYIIQKVKEKRIFSNLKKENKKITKESSLKNYKKEIVQEDIIEESDIKDIRDAISDALENDTKITLTNFEEDQERTAIISIDELMEKAKELDLLNEYEDDNTGINYLEKYNLEPSEIENKEKIDDKTEVKAFKVSQVISPIYGVKKEAINGNMNNN